MSNNLSITPISLDNLKKYKDLIELTWGEMPSVSIEPQILSWGGY